MLNDCVSTGKLPRPDDVQELVDEAYAAYRNHRTGVVSDVYPALSQKSPDLFGIALMGTNGRRYVAGDAEHPFAIMSVSKPFVFALVCEALGAERVREALGVNATGLSFNALSAIERGEGGKTNPMVNPGAIATTSLAPGGNPHKKWQFISEGLSRFAGVKLEVGQDVYQSAMATNDRTRSIAHLLHSYGRLFCDADIASDLYTRQCALDVTALDLAVMGATLADGGVNPLTGEPVVSAATCRYTLAVMTIAGLYETSGDWLYDTGLPGKSGIGGGIVTVSPGKGGLGSFAPRLDDAGNSVQGQLAAKLLSRRLGLDLFASQPATTAAASPPR